MGQETINNRFEIWSRYCFIGLIDAGITLEVDFLFLIASARDFFPGGWYSDFAPSQWMGFLKIKVNALSALHVECNQVISHYK